MLERTLVFVDTSYLLASFYNSWDEGTRTQLEIDLPEVCAVLGNLITNQLKQPIQRQAWYDGIPESGPHRYQRALRTVDGVQLRQGLLIETGQRRTQKAVDTRLVADMVVAAMRAQASDFVLVSGDQDMIPGVQEAITAGIRVHLYGFSWESMSNVLRHTCDSTTLLDPREDFADCMQILPLEGPMQPQVSTHTAPAPEAPQDPTQPQGVDTDAPSVDSVADGADTASMSDSQEPSSTTPDNKQDESQTTDTKRSDVSSALSDSGDRDRHVPAPDTQPRTERISSSHQGATVRYQRVRRTQISVQRSRTFGPSPAQHSAEAHSATNDSSSQTHHGPSENPAVVQPTAEDQQVSATKPTSATDTPVDSSAATAHAPESSAQSESQAGQSESQTDQAALQVDHSDTLQPESEQTPQSEAPEQATEQVSEQVSEQAPQSAVPEQISEQTSDELTDDDEATEKPSSKPAPSPLMMAPRRRLPTRYVPLPDEIWSSAGFQTPFDVGQQYATFWFTKIASEEQQDTAHLLSGGGLPSEVDRPLLQFACEVLHEYTLSESQRVALRDGFHTGIRAILTARE